MIREARKGNDMFDLTFEIDGKRVDPNNIADALERSVFATIAQELRSKLASVRDPDTGEFPTVVVRGNSLDNISIVVEGSDAVVALASAQLNDDFDTAESQQSQGPVLDTPNVFLCHASEDKPIVERLARDLAANGIEVFFDQWCIQPGDSIRQRIDSGLTECTHFVVVLTETSITKPWVNLEMDAGLVRKLDGRCRFVPLRHQLDPKQLPPTLAGLHSPALNDYATDLQTLVGFFFGVTSKPPLGEPPEIIKNRNSSLGVSAAAKLVIDRVMAGTKHALPLDPQLAVSELRPTYAMTDEQIEDAVFELEGRGFVERNKDPSSSLDYSRIYPNETLFVAFDKFYGDNDPSEDGLVLAVALMNQFQEGVRTAALAEQLDWPARRLNPAINYLSERDLIHRTDALATGSYCTAAITPTHATRRFVASRGS